jgi:hypothetical protein
MSDFPFTHYSATCSGPVRVQAILMSKLEGKFGAQALPQSPYLPRDARLVPGFQPGLHWRTCEEVSRRQRQQRLRSHKYALAVVGPDQRMPAWRNRAFVGTFGDPFVRDTELEGGHIAPSLDAITHVVRIMIQQGRMAANADGISPTASLATASSASAQAAVGQADARWSELEAAARDTAVSIAALSPASSLPPAWWMNAPLSSLQPSVSSGPDPSLSLDAQGQRSAIDSRMRVLSSLERVLHVLQHSASTVHLAKDALDALVDRDLRDTEKVQFAYRLMRNWRRRLRGMRPGDVLVLPGGWISASVGHAIMHVITMHLLVRHLQHRWRPFVSPFIRVEFGRQAGVPHVGARQPHSPRAHPRRCLVDRVLETADRAGGCA